MRIRLLALLAVIMLFSLVGCGSDTAPTPSESPTVEAPANALLVTMWSSGEKMNYLKDLADQFNNEKHTLPGDSRPIWVQAYTVNSGTMSDYLTGKIRDGVNYPQGVTDPTLVSPSVDHWLSRVNYLTGKEIFDLPNTKDLALTPVVIATYEEMARALGWPEKEIGWSDIIALAQSPEGWAAYPGAKVEWGKKPLLAWTDPAVSSTARTALFAAYAAAANKAAEQLQVSDIHDPAVQTYMKDLQGAVDHYFPETLKLQTKIYQGPKFIHFAPLEEYMLPWMRLGKVNAESVPGGKSEAKPLDKRMVAIYPKEGTIWHNNPGAILQNVPWTTPEQQKAAAVWVDYLLQPAAQQKAMEWGFRPANPNVQYGPYLSMEYGIDPGKPSKVLGRVDPKVAEEIMRSWQDVKKPGIVVLVMDMSGSMKGEKLDKAKEAAMKFLDVLSPQNKLGLVTFASTVESTVEVAGLSDSKFQVADIVQQAEAGGGTALYDAIKQAVIMADEAPSDGESIRGVVVLSDGMRTAGDVNLSDIVDLMTSDEKPVTYFEGTEDEDKSGLTGAKLAFPTEHRIHVFSVAYGDDADFEILRILAEATNSTFNKAQENNLDKVMETFGKYF